MIREDLASKIFFFNMKKQLFGQDPIGLQKPVIQIPAGTVNIKVLRQEHSLRTQETVRRLVWLAEKAKRKVGEDETKEGSGAKAPHRSLRLESDGKQLEGVSSIMSCLLCQHDSSGHWLPYLFSCF